MSIFSRQRETTEVFDAPTTVIDDIAGDYALDITHTRLGFSARHAMVTTVRGGFNAFEGTAHIDTANPAASSVQLSIDAASISTGVADRDGHLRSADFFDVETYPTITFRSTGAKDLDGDRFTLEGDLTVRDVTRPVSFTATYNGLGTNPWGQQVVGFEGRVELDREDFGLTWNQALETGGVLVGKVVTIDIAVEASPA
jgi:polyisoprenoid-binding protein YceI